MIIIGITGTFGAGKGAVVDYLKNKYQFNHYSARDFLAKEIRVQGLAINRDTLTEVGNRLRSEHHSGFVIEQLYNQALGDGKNSVIESVRTVGEVAFLKQHSDTFKLLAVDADPHLRYERIKQRQSATDNVSFEKFIADEQREMVSEDPNKQNISYCLEIADYTMYNNHTLADLQQAVDDILAKLL